MNPQPALELRWLSPLGISVLLFLLINLMYLVIGLLTPIVYRFYGSQLTEQFGLVFSPRSDMAAFGRPAHEVIGEQPAILAAKLSTYDMYFGMYVAVAILHFCVVWFELRYGQRWSLWALTSADAAVILFFLLAARDFSVRLAPLELSDLAPYALLPAAILPFAAVFGWIGVHQG